MLPSSPDDRFTTTASILLIIAVTALAWGAVPGGTFQFDDFRNVVRDPATTDAAILLERLREGLRPLTRLSYFADARLYGMNAAGFLATNLFLHAITVLLVFALARRRLATAGALIAALLFAAQPANAEVVAYVSGRSTGLMTPLLLAGLLMYDRGRSIAALVLFFLACLAKEHALIFPALVLVWEATRPEPRAGAARHLVITGIVAAVTAALLLSIGNYRTLVAHALTDRSIVDNVLANVRAAPEMFSLWVRPWALSVDHGFDLRADVRVSIFALALLLGVFAVAVVQRRRRPLLAFAIAWALVALVPTNSILAKPDVVTEKPLYLAWVGPSIALAGGLSGLLQATASRITARGLQIAAALVLCALVGASAWRASLWRDPVALWADAVEKAPYKSRAWNNLGMSYLAAQRYEDAVMAFERAVFLDPRNEYAAMNVFTARALCACRQEE